MVKKNLSEPDSNREKAINPGPPGIAPAVYQPRKPKNTTLTSHCRQRGKIKEIHVEESTRKPLLLSAKIILGGRCTLSVWRT